ncbi:MAG TPA: TfoX/Sxy family protein [Candidatus Dormibacteraeota bacterium]|nr:TfoX/Sxy family protein [Candidatus Dormibacteraeota bacterium]
MRFEPSPESLVALFDRVVPAEPDVKRRKMFGWPAAFVGGNMVAGLHRDALFLRLPPGELEQVTALGGRPFEPMAGRAMRGYVVVPETMLQDEQILRGWAARAIGFGRTLPAK